jgi:dynein heavy chain
MIELVMKAKENTAF